MTDRPPRVAQFHHRSHSRKTLCNQDCVVRERLDASVLRTLFRLRVLASCYKHSQYLSAVVWTPLAWPAGGTDTRFARFTNPGKLPSTPSPVVCTPSLGE